MHIEQRLEFLQSLPAVPASVTPVNRALTSETPIDPDKESGTVGPEMINIYLKGVSEQNRSDVDNCKLLVQNAANKLYDPIKELDQWYKYYTESLSMLGWVTQKIQTKDQTIKQAGLTMDAVAMHVIQGLLGGNAGLLMELGRKALDGVQNSQGLIDLYNRGANVGSDAKFDMSPVWQTNEGSPMMIFNCNKVDVKESTRGILFWKSTSQETKILTAAQAVYLNTEVYAQLREEILKKLGDAGKRYLGQLPDFD